MDYFCNWKGCRENVEDKKLSPFILGTFDFAGRYTRSFISKDLLSGNSDKMCKY